MTKIKLFASDVRDIRRFYKNIQPIIAKIDDAKYTATVDFREDEIAVSDLKDVITGEIILDQLKELQYLEELIKDFRRLKVQDLPKEKLMELALDYYKLMDRSYARLMSN